MELKYYLALISVLLPAWAILYWIVPYFTSYRHLQHIPGPFIAKFSNIWLALGARKGQKFAWVDYAHRKYGKVIRVGFNHVSIATPEGLHTVYAHGNGFVKDRFYEAFVSGVPGVFNVRDRAEHTRKRKIIAHAFSPTAVHQFEPHMAANLTRWVHQLDKIASVSAMCRGGYARMNMMPWCTFLAFDIIGDLAFGAPFGMVERGADECEATLPGQPGTTFYVPGAETLNRRGEVSSTLGLLLDLKPYARYLPDPFFRKGIQSIKNLHGMAEAAVAKRLGTSSALLGSKVPLLDPPTGPAAPRRHDILEMLCRAKDGAGNPMPHDELVSEALTELIAGSDTVSNTTCAVIYWILDGERRRPGTVVPRLQAELDAAMGPPPPPLSSSSLSTSPTPRIAQHRQVRDLPFLRRCIDEGMRLHSTSAIGLPRIVTAPQGVAYHGPRGGDEQQQQKQQDREYLFPQGTVLSVPSFSLHHDEELWGPDVEEFRPDRWLRLTPRQKVGFNPFSYGPRACVGQNVALMELALIVGTAFHRYEFQLYQPKLESHEGFSKKPVECWVGIKIRQGEKGDDA